MNVSGRFNDKQSSKAVLSVTDEIKEEPYFDLRGAEGSSGIAKNVSALIGKTAFLSCIVKNLGPQKSVSGLVEFCYICVIIYIYQYTVIYLEAVATEQFIQGVKYLICY